MQPADRLLDSRRDTPGLAGALLFALVAERLMAYYDHGEWPRNGPMRQQALDWLDRARLRTAVPGLRELVDASDDLARGIATGLSREAGLHTAHEMRECLDPNHRSAIGEALMAQCVTWAATLGGTASAAHAEPGARADE